MKLQFTHKAYQAAAVEAVVECFAGQPESEGAEQKANKIRNLLTKLRVKRVVHNLGSRGEPRWALLNRENLRKENGGLRKKKGQKSS